MLCRCLQGVGWGGQEIIVGFSECETVTVNDSELLWQPFLTMANSGIVWGPLTKFLLPRPHPRKFLFVL